MSASKRLSSLKKNREAYNAQFQMTTEQKAYLGKAVEFPRRMKRCTPFC
jgi:hypothetical protein